MDPKFCLVLNDESTDVSNKTTKFSLWLFEFISLVPAGVRSQLSLRHSRTTEGM